MRVDGRTPANDWVRPEGRTADWVGDQIHSSVGENIQYQTVQLAVNGVRKRSRSGAVKVDLSCADKSIRRPDSAPDLVRNIILHTYPFSTKRFYNTGCRKVLYVF